MKAFQHKFQFITDFVRTIQYIGIILILLGILIFLFPKLLEILIGSALILLGIIALLGSKKINKYSTISIPYQK